MKKYGVFTTGILLVLFFVLFWRVEGVLATGLFLAVTLSLAYCLGNYLYFLWSDERMNDSWLGKLERKFFNFSQIETKEMRASSYFKTLMNFSLISILVLTIILWGQNLLPFPHSGKSGMSFLLALNTAVSFVTNTDWQSYSGETTLTNISQMLGLTVQNFVAPAVGMAVAFAVFRGFSRTEQKTVGNFWRDLYRTIIYLLVPLAFISSLVLVSQGVVQTLKASLSFHDLSNQATSYVVGPVASQEAIKLLGTNGGGFFGANSAHPFENPTIFTNYFEMLLILLLPLALLFAFGKVLKARSQATVLISAMTIVFVVMFALASWAELHGSAGYFMEGKETMNGVLGSTLFGTVSTATSTGAVNASMASLSGLGSLPFLFLMQLGEIIYGGVGSGLYGVLGFILLTVFIASLMIGRTPEYLGKKIEPLEVRMAAIILLLPTVLTLLATAIVVLLPGIGHLTAETGPHSFTEILYNFTSMANNNGSGFSGFVADTPFLNLLGALVMFIARFGQIYAALMIAGGLVQKKRLATNSGTLQTNTVLFGGLFLGVILIVGALSFLPSLALGPIADYFMNR